MWDGFGYRLWPKLFYRFDRKGDAELPVMTGHRDGTWTSAIGPGERPLLSGRCQVAADL